MSENNIEEALDGLIAVKNLSQLADRISMHLPKNKVISLNIENGSAWVTLKDSPHDNNEHILPDATDKTLIEQLNDALCVANGFHT